MSDEFEYYKNKKPSKTYVSKRISLASFDQQPRPIRIASKVLDSPQTYSVVLERGSHVIRLTGAGRQEIVAKFYEDSRGILSLIIQRFTTTTGKPHKTSFSFYGDEVTRLLEFISSIKLLQLPDAERINVADSELKKLLLSPDQVRTLMVQNQELVLQMARDEITSSDLIALGYRKKELDRFRKLLYEPDHFDTEKQVSGLTDEGVWQAFFEKNKWVFGYGLAYVFLSSLDERKLEQVVVGYDLSGPGKRGDAVMKSRGAIEALCFIEVKKPTTSLLKPAPYRSGCWSASDEVSGGVAQVQGTVEGAIRRLTEKVEPTSPSGDPTGESLFSYQPKSFLVVGSLEEFKAERGISTEKYRSFELYRRNLFRPEILTFDELYARAKFIVQHVND